MDKKSLFDGAPLDDDGFTLVDRWYCKETDTFYPVGTTTWGVEADMLDKTGIKYDGTHFNCDENLTDYDHSIQDDDSFYGCCPICGCDYTFCDDESVEDFDSVVIRTYHCSKCHSEYSFTYWIKAIVIHKDGRFDVDD